jgi:putative flippase GtrA
MVSRSVVRDAAWYVAVGLLQLALDVAVFSTAFWAGVPAAPANLLGRVAGACIGFWLNGRYTFADAGQPRLGRRRFLRFLLAWLALTLLSTAAMHAAEASLPRGQVYWVKPLVEVICAGLGFWIARRWIYR